jgi:hypothetical protein
MIEIARSPTAGHMNSWIKTCRALAPSLAVRLGRGATTVIVTTILLGSNALSQSDSEKLGIIQIRNCYLRAALPSDKACL